MKKIILILIAVVSISNYTMAQGKVTNLSSADFKTQIENSKTAVVIDLRTPDEISKGFIAGAIFIDYLSKDAEQQLLKLDKNKTYYIYCASGGRSSDAAEFMNKQGFKNIFNLEKGFSDWKNKGFAFAKK